MHMIIRTRNSIVRGSLLALLFILGLGSVSWGAEYWLRAETLTKTMPDTSVITMWGFAQCTDGSYASCTPATVPGPRLSVSVADSTLTINLRNNLTGPLVEPVSIVIPGQTASMSPVKFTDGSGRQRVKSFTIETPPNNTTTNAYTWTNMKPGTYLYQSGSHPAVQVQMGLYGAVTKDFAAGQAYGPSTVYDSEALLLFSEIDPVLHGHVAAGTYGQPPPTGITSTMDYEPKYFLVNGAPYSASSAPLPAGSVGSNVLLRFLNAGLKTHVPVIQGTYLSIVAEDGNTYPFAKQQYSLLLPAGKTTDAIFTPTISGTYALYDRRLALTNGAVTGGGLLVNLNVATTGPGKIGVFQQGTWYLDASGNGAWDGAPPDSLNIFGVGLTGALPATGDWNGSGTAKVGVFTDGTWYLDTNGSGAWDGTPTDGIYMFGAGIPGALPVAGDWDGTGSSKIGVYNNNTWWIDFNGNGAWDGIPTDLNYVFDAGIVGGIPVTGDWNATGATKIGVYLDGSWYLDLNGNGIWDGTPTDATYAFGTGLTGAVPVTGDWTGTGTTKIGVYVDGTWYVDLNGNGAWDGTPTDGIYAFGTGVTGALPVSGLW